MKKLNIKHIARSTLKHVSAISALVGLYLYVELSLIEKRDMERIDKLITK